MFGAVTEIGIPGLVSCPVPAKLVAAFLAGALFDGFWPDTVTAAMAIEKTRASKRVSAAEVIQLLLITNTPYI